MKLSNEQLEAMQKYESFVKYVVLKIKIALSELDVSIEECESRVGSRYYNVYGKDIDGDYFNLICKFRVSDHKQAHSGPVWSFEMSDAEEQHSNGIDALKKEINNY